LRRINGGAGALETAMGWQDVRLRILRLWIVDMSKIAYNITVTFEPDVVPETQTHRFGHGDTLIES
jgi:hypothetical protein